MLRLGALPAPTGGTDMCVWAPNATTVAVRGQALERDRDGFFGGNVALEPGADYRFELDGLDNSDR